MRRLAGLPEGEDPVDVSRPIPAAVQAHADFFMALGARC